MKNTMKRLSVLFVILFVAGATKLAAEVPRDHSVVFVHGRSSTNHTGAGGIDVGNYWGSSKNILTTSKIWYVGYDGSTDPRTYGSTRAQTWLYAILEHVCTGAKSCTIICHSAGCYATEYFLERTNSTYNVDKVVASASAAGGSELADLAFWASDDMVSALQTNVARTSYNHNDTKGTGIWALAAMGGGETILGKFVSKYFLPLFNDSAVALHSACGQRMKGTFIFCYEPQMYENHFVWDGSQAYGYISSMKSYSKTHSGDGSYSINTSMNQEWNLCHILGKGCN